MAPRFSKYGDGKQTRRPYRLQALIGLAALLACNSQVSVQTKSDGKARATDTSTSTGPDEAPKRPPLAKDTDPPSSFAIIGPASYATSPTPTLSWSAAKGASRYDVVITSSPQCTSDEHQSHQGLTATELTLRSLADGAYFACVTASDEAGNRALADNSPYPFAVDTSAPADFVMTGPSALSSSRTPLAQWSEAAGASTYTLQISASDDCSTPLQAYDGLESIAGTTPSQILTPLPDGTYFACVTALDAAGNATKAPAHAFTIDASPPGSFETVAIASPGNDPTPTLAWSVATDAIAYAVTIATASDCGDSVQLYSPLEASTLTLQPLADGAYHACVSAFDAAGNVTSASPQRFVVDATPPGSPSITGPATPGTNSAPTVVWSAAPEASHYDLVISATADCSNPLQSYTALAATSKTLTSLADGIYYACLTARDDAQNARSATNDGYPFVIDTTPPAIALGPRRITGNSFTIRPSVMDSTALTFAWSVVSGPGSVTIGSPTAKDTLIAATSEGDYVLRLTATDQVGLSSDATVSLTWDRSRLVSAGRHVSCAIAAGGQLHCWGRNRQGEVGTGDMLQRTSPFAVAVGPERSVLSVAVASFHTCAILDDGSVRCWGGNLTETGYGDGVDRLMPSSEPVSLGEGRRAVALAAGYSHTCAVLDDGSVKCWGANSNGQLGYGDTTDRSTPPATAIDLGAGRSAVEITMGSLQSCALLDDGTVKCWGASASGQLGYGDTAERHAPPATPISMPGGLAAKHIDAGNTHVCAILSDDSIACWGSNNLFQLGDRTSTARSSPVLVSSFSGTPKRLALGSGHSCALRVDGSVTCWGHVPTTNGAGREAGPTDCTDGVSLSTTLCTAAGGVFSSFNRDCSIGVSTSPAACVAAGGSWGSCSDFTKVSSGTCAGTWDPSKFAYCGSADGTKTATAYCTSLGGVMQGNGYCRDPSYASRAACLAAGKTWHIASVPGPALDFGVGRSAIALESGMNASWVCAVLDNLDLKCWGDNTNGQLGYGDSYISATYAEVDLGTGETAQSVAVALSHTCALTGSGVVKCWGDNSYGKLGNGTYVDTAVPTTVSLAAAATDLATQRDHGCAVLSTGAVQCWGTHGSGRLGSGSSSGESASPVNVTNLGGTAIQVVAGADFTCALLAGGAVKCWGSMAQGRLGSGSAAVATSCSDGVQTSSTACTDVGGTFNGNLYADCSNGISTSQAACEAVTNGKWAHCSNGISSTATLCTNAAKVWDPSLYGYCTSSAATVAAGTFCTSTGGGFTNYGYCADPSYKTRPTCLNAGKTWHVHTLPGPALDFGGVPATQLAAGAHGACALLQGGSVRCWGGNNYMQIGVNDTVTTNNYLVPAPAIDFGGHTVKRISASSTFFCAILDDDSLRCWGGSSTHYGQLGYPATTGNIPMPSATAVDFGAGRSVQAVATQSDGHENCAILDDDSLRCFGNTSINLTSGILKDDNTSTRLSPIDLGTAAAPTSVSVGNFAYCVTFADGKLRCSGHHNHGQPGQGFANFRWLPPTPSVLGL